MFPLFEVVGTVGVPTLLSVKIPQLGPNSKVPTLLPLKVLCISIPLRFLFYPIPKEPLISLSLSDIRSIDLMVSSLRKPKNILIVQNA